MNEKTNKALEYVSALMDGEALTDEMLDAVLADEEALRAWHEYHIIGDCIRQGAAAKVADEAEIWIVCAVAMSWSSICEVRWRCKRPIMTVPDSESPTASRNVMSVTSCEARGLVSHQASTR